MNVTDMIRTWIDEAFRNSHSKEQRAMLPVAPAGAVELNEADLDAVAGASFLFDT